MSNNQRPSRRIVSKSEYAANIGRKSAAFTSGAGLICLSLVCAVIVCLLLWFLVAIGVASDYALLLIFWGMTGGLAYGARYVMRLGVRSIREAKQIDTGVPLTHASVADLPATDSLVRASEEPLQAQKTILLRASGETQEWHSEQLLRAAEERE